MVDLLENINAIAQLPIQVLVVCVLIFIIFKQKKTIEKLIEKMK